MKKVLYLYLAITLLLSISNCYALDSRQTALTAAYLFRISLFVSWPKSLKNDIVFCVAKDHHYTQLIADVLLDEQINQRPVQVITVSSHNQLEKCQLLFIPETARQIDDFLRAGQTQTILTVGETEYFYQHGGMIYLYLVDNRLQFAINYQSVKQSGITINAQLLQLAREPD